MAVRSSWSGAVEFGGFPINLKAYPLITSPSAQSFKSLCPCHHLPIQQVKRCTETGDVIAHADLRKGVEVNKTIHVLSEEAVDAITKGEATPLLKIAGLPSRASVPLHLAKKHYRLVPDSKVPGSASSASVLWNGLKGNDRALITEWVARSGSRNELVAITADEYGLTAVVLPYDTDLNEVPEHAFTEDAEQAAVFDAFAQQQGMSTDDYSSAAFEDAYGRRREMAVQSALNGTPVEPQAKPAAPEMPDLMAALKASMGAGAATPKKAPAKPRAKKAVKS